MWFRSNDKAHASRKFRKVRRSHKTKRKDASAIGVWYQAALWSADHQMDGFCPNEVLETFDDEWELIVERCVAVVGASGEGLFVPDTHDGEEGVWVHDFLEFNDSAAEQLANATAASIRKALYADPELVAAIKERDKDRCRYCGCRVKWSDRRSMAGGTFDHVIPLSQGGTNTIENVVVCCRRCNGKKGERSLSEAGMKRLRCGSLGAPVLAENGSSSAGVEGRAGTGRGQVGNQSGSSSDGAADGGAR